MTSHNGLDTLATRIHATARQKGFWPDRYYKYGTTEVPTERDPRVSKTVPAKEVTDEAIGTKLVLVHSEVTEVLEAVRKEKGQAEVVEEMADIVIRLLDLYAALKVTGQVDDSLDDVVQLKMKKNEQRPQLHGNRF